MIEPEEIIKPPPYPIIKTRACLLPKTLHRWYKLYRLRQ